MMHAILLFSVLSLAVRKPENFVNLALSVAVGVRSHISESICRKGQNRDHYDDDAQNCRFTKVSWSKKKCISPASSFY